MGDLKIALNKTYLTIDGDLFSPIRTRKGKPITTLDYFDRMNPIKNTPYNEIIFIDKDGKERPKSELKHEVKWRSSY